MVCLFSIPIVAGIFRNSAGQDLNEIFIIANKSCCDLPFTGMIRYLTKSGKKNRTKVIPGKLAK